TFFFSSRRRHTRSYGDWSSDVCSSDLLVLSCGRLGNSVTRMDLEGIRIALRRQPFEPFSIRLTDGRSMAVRHPEFVAVGHRRVKIGRASCREEEWGVGRGLRGAGEEIR